MKARITLASDLGDIINAMVDARVDERLRELGVAGAVVCYSPERLPPGTSARVFRETCASGAVAGAVKEGRSWRVSREAWHKARGRRPAPKLRIVPSGALSVEELASSSIAQIRAGGRR